MVNIGLLMVTFNRDSYLQEILLLIQSFSWTYSRFMIINNASEDGTSEVLEEFRCLLNLEIITLPENIGHGAGLAQGLRRLEEIGDRPDYVVFLEDDSFPKADYLDYLVKVIQHHSFSFISSAGYLVRLGKRINLFPKYGEVIEADFGLFDGAIAKFEDLIQVGYPVEDWFMMVDDFEYCYRIRKAGFTIGVMNNPFVEILHEGWAGTTSSTPLWRSYYQSRNFVHFVLAHLSWFTFLDALILNSKRLVGGVFVKNGWKLTRLRLMGFRAGIQGKKGRSLDLKTLKEP